MGIAACRKSTIGFTILSSSYTFIFHPPIRFFLCTKHTPIIHQLGTIHFHKVSRDVRSPNFTAFPPPNHQTPTRRLSLSPSQMRPKSPKPPKTAKTSKTPKPIVNFRNNLYPKIPIKAKIRQILPLFPHFPLSLMISKSYATAKNLNDNIVATSRS